jgi:hypothetical protein
MNILIEKIFGPEDIAPPAQVRESFLSHFHDFKNEEWQRRNKDWEVIFYLDDRECIAVFDGLGKLKELKSEMKIDQVPEIISGKVMELGETMNIIEIRGDGVLTFEIIYRNPQMMRFLCILDDRGNVMVHQKL